MSQQSVYKVVRNQLGRITRIDVNGGGRIESRYTLVSSAINALQDHQMGLFTRPEPGLHIKTYKDENDSVSDIIGAVGIYYQGVELDAPERGWAPVQEIDGYLSIATFKNDEHKMALIRKHAYLHRIFEGVGFSMSMGSQLARKMEAALKKIQSRDLDARSTGIRSKIHGDRVWNRVDTSADLPESVIIPMTDGNKVDLFTVAPGSVFALVDYAGRELVPTRWNPAKKNNVLWWEKFSESNGKIVELV